MALAQWPVAPAHSCHSGHCIKNQRYSTRAQIFFSVHFYRCNCISITVCYFSEKYSCNCIFFCKYLLIGFKVVEKSIRPIAGNCKKVSAPCFKAIKKKCPPHGLLHRPHDPNKFCPVPKRLKRSYFWPNLSDSSRQKEDREKTHQTRPVASQYASMAMLHTNEPPKITRKYAFMDIPRINIKHLTRMFC